MTKHKIQRRIAERLMEDESLTADLVDEAASVLLDWGLAQAQGLAQQAEALPPEELDARLTDLRRTMKRINREAGEAEAQAQAEQVRALLSEIGLPQEPEPPEPSAADDRETADDA